MWQMHATQEDTAKTQQFWRRKKKSNTSSATMRHTHTQTHTRTHAHAHTHTHTHTHTCACACPHTHTLTELQLAVPHKQCSQVLQSTKSLTPHNIECLNINGSNTEQTGSKERSEHMDQFTNNLVKANRDNTQDIKAAFSTATPLFQSTYLALMHSTPFKLQPIIFF